VGLLSSRVGIAAYLLLPNRWVWALLSEEERQRIERGNRRHNTTRSDYADPRRYRNGQSFDSTNMDATTHERAKALREFLDRRQPRSVLEVGPGSGQLTRIIVEHRAVTDYTAVDINRAFLDFLRPRLAAVDRPELTCSFVEGTIDDVAADRCFDAVVLLSSVHHIPDRARLFAAIDARLSPRGRLLAIDPTHYLLRWRQLLRKLMVPGYLATALEDARAGRMSTHAMCQLAEYQAVTRRTGLRLARVQWRGLPRKVRRLRSLGVPLGPLARWTAQEVLVECERASARTPAAVTVWQLQPVRLLIVLLSLWRR
jgi:SAM-dependent methyltransferase